VLPVVFLYAVLAAIGSVQALPGNGAFPGPTVFQASNEKAPRPTEPPKDLLLRDDSQPAGLCGFVNGTTSWICQASSTCFFNTDNKGVACCQSSACQWVTSCIPFSSSSVAVTWPSKPIILPITARILGGGIQGWVEGPGAKGSVAGTVVSGVLSW
jgi:hypothetical protein